MDVCALAQGFYNEIEVKDISEAFANQEYWEYSRNLWPKRKAVRQLGCWFHLALITTKFLTVFQFSKTLTSILIRIHIFSAPFSDMSFKMSSIDTELCLMKESWRCGAKKIISQMISNKFHKMTTIIIYTAFRHIEVWRFKRKRKLQYRCFPKNHITGILCYQCHSHPHPLTNLPRIVEQRRLMISRSVSDLKISA